MGEGASRSTRMESRSSIRGPVRTALLTKNSLKEVCRDLIDLSTMSNRCTDRDAFASMLETFQQYLPVAQPPDLLGLEGYLYDKTFGCIGVLKTLLNNALSMALRSDAETITETMLKESALPTRDLLQMSREIADGERVLRETDEQVVELRTFLNTVPKSTAQGNEKGNTGAV